MDDHSILTLAIENNSSLLITMDKDFGELIYKSAKQPFTSILLLRLEDATSIGKLSVIENLFSEHLNDILQIFSVYKNGKLRINPIDPESPKNRATTKKLSKNTENLSFPTGTPDTMS